MQEEKQPPKQNEGGVELPGAGEAAPCWSACFAGSAVEEAGGSVVAHGRRLPEAATISNGGATVFQWFSFILPVCF
jgi:hypothetical protein